MDTEMYGFEGHRNGDRIVVSNSCGGEREFDAHDHDLSAQIEEYITSCAELFADAIVEELTPSRDSADTSLY